MVKLDIFSLTLTQAWDLYCDLFSKLAKDHSPKDTLSILHPTFGHLGWT